MPSHRTTDVLFVVSAALGAAAIGWHYRTRISPVDTEGERAFIAQLFDDAALRERRWTVLGEMAPVGSYVTRVAAKGDDLRELVTDIEVDKVYRITARTRQRWHRVKGFQLLDGQGTIGDQGFVFTAERQGDFVEIRIYRDGALVHERLVESRDLPAGFSPFLPMKSLKVGDSWKVATVNALEGGVTRDRIVVEGVEELDYRGERVSALKVVCDGRKGVRAWYGPGGEVLRADFRYWMLRLRLEFEPGSPTDGAAK